MLLAHAAPDEQPPAQKRPGPPLGSRNAMRHGLRCGALPKGCRRIEADVNEFRRALEDAVVAARGSVSVNDGATIARATKWETHGRLAQRWLAKQGDTLTPDQLLRFSQETVRAATERDRAISDLKLDERNMASLWGNHGGQGEA